ncbi:ephrin type-A receptor 4a-like isoform X1 [Anoplophora glabripennis]|uniref:ephrin type-A receptor 4a-like isoform X1 n=1 Tax=Anoplophora glabripennis TaxID=217634 RepID=UPI00087569C6|nr:ephrin type-A receptor 4a-like isoform X1 [Anoplophora glabripennis]
MDINEDTKIRKFRAMHILEKVLEELRFEGGNKIFLTLLEKMLGFNDGPTHISPLRRDIAVIFLEEMEKKCTEDIGTIYHDLEDLFMPKKLRQITREVIQIKEICEFDRGAFGIVSLGELTRSDGSVQKVVIKKAGNKKHESMLLKEAKVMVQLDHKNVVKLLAFQKGNFKIVMEYMEWQSIDDAVQINNFTKTDILKALHDVASGMEYISERKYVHRDLACRNVFVDSNKGCKIGDIGLSRYIGHCGNEEIREKKYLLTMYNTAPEAMALRIFSTKSYVWSFGILIWELYYTMDDFSFLKYNLVNTAVEFFRECGILGRPKTCPQWLYLYVTDAILLEDPRERPSFTAIREKIEEMLTSPTPPESSSSEDSGDSDYSYCYNYNDSEYSD